MPFEGISENALLPAAMKLGKVIFSELCVKNSVHIQEQCMLGECILVFMKFMKFQYPEVFNSFKDF